MHGFKDIRFGSGLTNRERCFLFLPRQARLTHSWKADGLCRNRAAISTLLLETLTSLFHAGTQLNLPGVSCGEPLMRFSSQHPLHTAADIGPWLTGNMSRLNNRNGWPPAVDECGHGPQPVSIQVSLCFLMYACLCVTIQYKILLKGMNLGRYELMYACGEDDYFKNHDWNTSQ